MKMNKSILFLVLIGLLFSGCIWFSQFRHQQKKELVVSVNFTHSPSFLNDSLVNKLLTQNLTSKSRLQKDSLDLSMLENQMNKTPEIENIEIFIQPQGALSLIVTERKPLFKVASEPPFFADKHGVLFSYKSISSTSYPEFKTSSSTVPLKTTASLIQNLKSDPFLATELETVSLEQNQYALKLKSFNFEVVFGAPTQVKEKINKLKVFCAFQRVQDSLSGYQKINLSYDKQVVATIF